MTYDGYEEMREVNKQREEEEIRYSMLQAHQYAQKAYDEAMETFISRNPILHQKRSEELKKLNKQIDELQEQKKEISKHWYEKYCGKYCAK